MPGRDIWHQLHRLEAQRWHASAQANAWEALPRHPTNSDNARAWRARAEQLTWRILALEQRASRSG
jgi:hypothetical protein